MPVGRWRGESQWVRLYDEKRDEEEKFEEEAEEGEEEEEGLRKMRCSETTMAMKGVAQ